MMSCGCTSALWWKNTFLSHLTETSGTCCLSILNDGDHSYQTVTPKGMRGTTFFCWKKTKHNLTSAYTTFALNIFFHEDCCWSHSELETVTEKLCMQIMEADTSGRSLLQRMKTPCHGWGLKGQLLVFIKIFSSEYVCRASQNIES